MRTVRLSRRPVSGRILLSVWPILLSVAAAAREVVWRPPHIVAPEIVWGSETNGVRAGIYVEPHPPFRVAVYIRTCAATNLASSAGHTSREISTWISGLYFRPTNSICALIKLSDTLGRSLPAATLRPGSIEPFADSFSLKCARYHFQAQFGVYSGPSLPPRSLGIGDAILGTIGLTNYFQVESPGQYVLTVKPKIYKRVFQDSDLVQRIDVPAVTVRFKWERRDQ